MGSLDQMGCHSAVARGVVLVAAVANAAKSSALDAYVAAWARGGDAARCGDVRVGVGFNDSADDCAWLAGYGPIDVGCSIEVTLGLAAEGVSARRPELRLRLADGSRVTVGAGDARAAERFRLRPAVCEYAAGGAAGRADPGAGDAPALLAVANSAEYLFRLWPLFLNRLLYATDVGLRAFLWIGELPAALERATAPDLAFGLLLSC